MAQIGCMLIPKLEQTLECPLCQANALESDFSPPSFPNPFLMVIQGYLEESTVTIKDCRSDTVSSQNLIGGDGWAIDDCPHCGKPGIISMSDSVEWAERFIKYILAKKAKEMKLGQLIPDKTLQQELYLLAKKVMIKNIVTMYHNVAEELKHHYKTKEI